MIEKKFVRLTDFQRDAMKPLTELVNEAYEGVFENDRRGLLFAQVKPHDNEMIVFFLPHDESKMLIETFEIIQERLDNPPRVGEKKDQ